MVQTIQERIIEQATDLFIKRGCKSLTMDDIANAMGISKRTIYENFADKEDLIQQSLLYFFERERKEIKVMLNSSDNIIDLIFKHIKSNSESLVKVKYGFFDEIRRYFPNVYAKIVGTFEKECLEDLRKLLFKGQRDGIFRKDINVKLCAYLVQEFVRLIFVRDALPIDDRMECTRVFMDTFTRGMSTENGLQLLNEYADKKRRSIKRKQGKQ